MAAGCHCWSVWFQKGWSAVVSRVVVATVADESFGLASWPSGVMARLIRVSWCTQTAVTVWADCCPVSGSAANTWSPG